ncbi:MAG: NAD(P)-dependent oxidoreductase, partial [Actinomycetes bacterium]
MRIGLLGIGRMGLPICGRLLAAGHVVIAFDPLPDRFAAAVERGARGAASMRDAAAAADVLITVLPGPNELAAAMNGSDGALAAMPAGAVWIDMTSASAAVCVPLQQEAAARGVTALEAPVGGGVRDAGNGTLTFFVGGDATVLDRHRELLAALGDRVLHVGGPGAGYTTKLLVNLLWFGQAVATAEALLLGERAGIDLAVLRDALAS